MAYKLVTFPIPAYKDKLHNTITYTVMSTLDSAAPSNEYNISAIAKDGTVTTTKLYTTPITKNKIMQRGTNRTLLATDLES